MAPLNPDAPKFIPSQHKLLHQPFTLPCFPPTTTPFPHQHCFSPLSPHQPLAVPFSPTPFYHHDDDTNIITKKLISTATPTQPKKLTGPYLSDIEPAIIQEACQHAYQKEEAKEASGLEGITHGQGGFEHKKEKDVVESQKCWGPNNKQISGRGAHKYSKAFPTIPVRVDGEETTVMIKNIPNKYTRDSLVDFLENQCRLENQKAGDEESDGNEKDRIILAFDVVYLPMDFRSGLNKGYAFVNFTSPKGAWRFNITASDMKWDLFQSEKILKVVAARLQGKEALQKHFEGMNFPFVSEEVLPICFNPPRDGLTNGSGEGKTFGRLKVSKSLHV